MMLSKSKKNFITLGITTIFVVILIMLLSFAVPSQITPVRETENLLDDVGSPITAVSIADITDNGVLQRANYTPDKFLHPTEIVGGEIIEIKKQNLDKLARRGTYQFIILNLDPMDEDYSNQVQRLEKYKEGDRNYHFTLYLPAVWSSCAVYVNSTLIATAGEISDYNFTDYSNFEKKNEEHIDGTKPIFIDLSFSSSKNTIAPDRLESARIITVHYETLGAKTPAGIENPPLIGSDSVVRGYISRDFNLLIVLAAISTLTLFTLTFLCFLKRTPHFLPQLLIGLGILGSVLYKLLRMGTQSSPFFLAGFGAFSFAFILLSATLCLRPKGKLHYLWFCALVLAVIHCFASLLLPSLAFSPAVFTVYSAIATATLGCILIGLLVIAAMNRHTEASLLLCPTISIALIVCAIFSGTSFVAVSPFFWLSSLIISIMIFVNFRVFISVEQRNSYLTANLQSEVARQTDGLQQIIDERDKILGFVSHDMKKSSVSIGRFLDTIREREHDGEQKKTIDIVVRKNNEMVGNFTELSNYSKLNYFAESSSEVTAEEILTAAFSSINPDCEANGIILIKDKITNIRIYAKPNGLTTVLKNLIFNAIEHADCSTITLSATKKKHTCMIAVTDNGKGININHDIFEPYISGSKTAVNSGLGLYICRNMITSMGGELFYTQSEGKLTFTVTLPLA